MREQRSIVEMRVPAPLRYAFNMDRDQRPVHTHLWRESINFYAKHFSGIIKTLLPATALAYAFATALDEQIQAVRRHVFTESAFSIIQRTGTLGFERLMIPIQLLTFLKQWLSWTCYCFALIGICELVRRSQQQDENDLQSVFFPIREKPFQFLKSGFLFFVLLVIAFFAMTVIIVGITDLQVRWRIALIQWENVLVGFIGIALVSAVLVRWTFVVPLMTIDGLSFRRAMTMSDRMTDDHALALWRLVLESEIAGYLILLVPGYVLYYLRVRPTVLTGYVREGAGLVLFALSQAPLMIGVGLLFARRRHSADAENLKLPMPL